ncbi:Proteophosphoglycan ppg4 [Rhodotorula toruloides ATCC 204091]|uniref:Proteophosphoglycan ppg4 n=2 Tax=Rhodotorula toruloides TaxID=5286 RepID=A0A2S9ZYZ8_RHOTO|nr:Proteophosphoglycan ppg4 [Rhodotorula toruloides ATCC 204091]PRQ70961.1 Proteophosphoglycan ppg4 [Rhodotorula toruloides]
MAPPPSGALTLAEPAQPATPVSRRFPLSRYAGQRPDYAFPPREKRSPFPPSSCDGLQTPSTNLARSLDTLNRSTQDDSSSGGTPDASFSSCDTGMSEQEGIRTPPTPPSSLRAGMDPFTSPSPYAHKLQDDQASPSAARESIVKPADQVLRDTTNSFFPSFGDFLASHQATEDEKAGASVWVDGGKDCELVGELEDDVGKLDLRKSEDKSAGAASTFRPFSPLKHKRDDSFTFHPSPAFRIDSPAPNPPSSSLLLRSPEPKRHYHLPTPVLTRTPEVPHNGPESPLSHYYLPPFPATPPMTPVHSATPHPPPKSHTAPLRPHFLAVPAQRARTVTPPGAVPFFHPPPPPPASVVALSVSSGPSAAADAFSSEYPLSESDTAKIANLHNGRIPTLQQLAPPDHVFAAAAQQPIVNTGNVGPMVVQAGDWRCGVCSFVNWRRRKICLKCFPYANDIGHVLTIQSQRAAYLAAPTSASHPGSTASASPAPLMQASYRSPYVPGGGPGGEVPTADLATLARTPNFVPSAPAFVPSSAYTPHSMPQQYSMPGPAPPLDAYFAPSPAFVPVHALAPPVSHFSSDSSGPVKSSPYPNAYRSTKPEPAPLPPIIWSTSFSTHARPPSFSSSSAASGQKSRTPSATSAGELAEQKKKREKENERVKAGKAVRNALQARVGASGMCFAVGGVAAGGGWKPWEQAEY